MVLTSVLLSGAFGVVFAVRGALHTRRTGESPFRGGAGIAGPAAIAVWVLVVLAGPIGDALGLGRLWRNAPLGVVGALVAGAAIVGSVWASVAMGRWWRIGVDPTEHTDLVVAGPFRFVRNPIYVAMLAFAAGLTLMIPNVLSVALSVLAAAAMNLHVRLVEEPHLERQHPIAYPRYRRATGRFVPRVRVPTSPAASR